MSDTNEQESKKSDSDVEFIEDDQYNEPILIDDSDDDEAAGINQNRDGAIDLPTNRMSTARKSTNPKMELLASIMDNVTLGSPGTRKTIRMSTGAKPIRIKQTARKSTSGIPSSDFRIIIPQRSNRVRQTAMKSTSGVMRSIVKKRNTEK